MEKRIAIQGFEGSFHQEAARYYHGTGISVVPCATFREAFKAAANRKLSDGGVLAIENSIAGSILPNYNLLQKHSLRVTGEIYMQIKQQLMVIPEAEFSDVHEVHSHPMAILQCLDYLEKHGWKLIETEDTALSARLLKQHHHKHAAAIASKLAAELFGLKIIGKNIHTLKNNFTRFLVVEPAGANNESEDVNKASLYFETTHKKGSLARVLTTIAEGGINLSKLQSFPIPGSDWKYFFHVDMEFDNYDLFQKVIAAIRKQTVALQLYGVYKKGITI